MLTDYTSTNKKSRSLRNLLVVATLILVTGILYIRRPDSFQRPQFWAEDGTVFFLQAYEQGARAHLIPYAGYYHGVPRLVASLAQAFLPRWAPTIFNFSALLVMLALATKLFSSRLDLRFPMLFALFPVLIPHFRGVVFLTLTNAQWPLALILVLTAIESPPETKGQRIVDGLLILMAGLTGPFVVLIVPIFAWRWLRHRTWPALETLALASTAALVQGWSFLRNPVLIAPDAGHSGQAWIDLLGWKVTGHLLIGHQAPYAWSSGWLAAGGALLLLYLLWRLVQFPPGRHIGLPLLLFGVGVFALSCFKFRQAANLLVPPIAGGRYLFIPFVIIVWCLLLVAIFDRRWFKVPALICLALILRSSLISGFTSPPMRNFRWPMHAERIGVEDAPVIPINPPGWKMRFQNRPEPPPTGDVKR